MVPRYPQGRRERGCKGLWQARPLDPLYPILDLDYPRQSAYAGAVRTKAAYLAIGVNMDGHMEVLGLWIAQTKGATFWLQVVTELKMRGVQDIFIACVDGLKGFPGVIEVVYPKTSVQLCIVHRVRNSLNFVPWKMQKEVATDLKLIYTSSTVELAEQMIRKELTPQDDARLLRSVSAELTKVN